MTPNEITPDWTLFLDRDGVLNVLRVADYVKTPEEFVWLPGAREALADLNRRFAYTFVTTNQQGVGKGLMSSRALSAVHRKFTSEALRQTGAFVDRIYVCTALASAADPRRKPGPGMALDAVRDYPAVDLTRSIIVGDSSSDITFGRAVGMRTVRVSGGDPGEADLQVASLRAFSDWLSGGVSGG